ncbi:unnamed protein product [Rotaria sordida]|uniref:Uncharacterized protein n=1 Tax=Rotaria sordida TaxID=392033 RepID=A0A818TTM4_9BILA|nr:unnamed protein product [Rotaria sordida]
MSSNNSIEFEEDYQGIHLKQLIILEFQDISNSYHMEMSFVLLEILKEASNLSSIRIAPHIFKSLFDDNDLQKYLNKTIRKGNNLFAK